MSTVVEIKAAIDRLSPEEKGDLESLVWPEWGDRMEGDAPLGVRQKLAEAAQGKFKAGNRRDLERLRRSLG